VSAEYWALVVSLTREAPHAAEAVTNFLWEAGAVGVVEEGEAEPVRVRAFFPSSADPAVTGQRLTAYLDALRSLVGPIGPGIVDVTPVPDEAWAEAWRAHFRPLPIGRRLLVCPPWEAPECPPVGPAGPRLVVLVEPGRAFGTGGHATTRGCLELLERALGVAPVPRVLDIGTGSGILAIAAVRLGVPRADAIDPDPDAVAAATANAARNGVGDRVRVAMETLESWSGRPAELVLANLLGATLVSQARPIARLCAAPGRLIAGGLLSHEAPQVVATFVPDGFRLVELTDHEGWATLLLERD